MIRITLKEVFFGSTSANKMELVSIKININKILQQYTSPDGKEFIAAKFDIADQLLPPMITLKAYEKRIK